tara:strand:- start:234 stop:410 length:177 start_codon:yes stop_codon:yes gene_type:complete
MPKYQERRKSVELPPNREILNKIDNDISVLRGEVMELKVLLHKLTELKKKESSGWIFS